MEKVCQMVGSLLQPHVVSQFAPYHSLNVRVLDLLQREGYIRGFVVNGSKIKILLKHIQGAPVIQNIRLVSRPSRAIYVTPEELKERTKFNTGLWVMQTGVGVISHRDCMEMGMGGKMLFAVNNGFQHFC
eukprot:GHVN01085085.1.p2 GENE.GHVN01085085.1~~GHVN01085085.1.p2  ORF type:complete len:130 (+),score=22.26 GHVN01085085.1:1434-1823(+)